jgi:membrane-associated phospholipid phosphatase
VTSTRIRVGFDMVRALIVSQTLTQGIKVAVRRDRPTGECCAFPSGHASATFATAAVIERHFGYRGSWPMFLIACYVATSRLHDNRHFLSDVCSVLRSASRVDGRSSDATAVRNLL